MPQDATALRDWGGLVAALSCPALLLDTQGRILASNDACARLFATNPALADVDGVLAFRRQADQSQYAEAFLRLTALGSRTPMMGPVVLSLRSRSNRPVLMLRMIRVAGSAIGTVLCTLEDLSAEIEDIAALARLLDITPAQANAAALLATGHSVPEIAELIGLQQATLRTHIRLAIERLGLSSQTELALYTARMARFAGHQSDDVA